MKVIAEVVVCDQYTSGNICVDVKFGKTASNRHCDIARSRLIKTYIIEKSLASREMPLDF